MSVLAVPRSIARSFENHPKIELKTTDLRSLNLPETGPDEQPRHLPLNAPQQPFRSMRLLRKLMRSRL